MRRFGPGPAPGRRAGRRSRGRTRLTAVAADRTGLIVVAGMFTPGDERPGAQHAARRRAGRGRRTTTRSTSSTPSASPSPTPWRPATSPVVIDVAGVPVGLTTCYDVRFPGLYTRLAEQGAEVICVAASWAAGPGKVDQWQLLTRARALDSTTFVLAAGQADPSTVGAEPAPGAPAGVGHSAAISPARRGAGRARGRARAARRRSGPGRGRRRPGRAIPVLANRRILTPFRRHPRFGKMCAMSRAEDQPWSPFPVQDWSALPEDPLGHSRSTRPGRLRDRTGRWWRAADRPRPDRSADRRGDVRRARRVGLTGPRTAATRVPAGGRRRRRTSAVETTREQKTEQSPAGHRVRPVQRAWPVCSAPTRASAARCWARSSDERDTIRIWRTTSTELDDPAAPYPSTRIYRANAAVELLGESIPDGGLRLPPGPGRAAGRRRRPGQRGAAAARPATSWTTGRSSGPTRPRTTAWR